jgi:hypothetical protein
MKLLLIFAVTAVFCSPVEKETDVKTSYPEDNQILFRKKGTVVNKSTFLHIRFKMDLNDLLLQMQKTIQRIADVQKKEDESKNVSILPYLEGRVEFKSLWKNERITELYRNRAMDGVVISAIFLEMLNGLYHRLNGTLTSLPEKYSVHESTLIHKIVKRDILLGGAALVIAGRNAYKIHQIENHLSELSSQHNELVDSVQLVSGQHKQLVSDVAILQQLFEIYDSKNYHKIIALSVALSSRLEDTIDRVESIITAGRQRRMSPSLLSGDELNQLYEAIRTKANDHNCEMILENPFDLYEMEATFGYAQEGRVFAIYVHVPLVERKEQLSLLEHLPFPILQSFTANATIFPKTGDDKYLALISTGEEVATSETTPPHRYRVFGEADLQACYRFRNVYLCGGRNTLRTDIQDSCIGSLWLMDHTLISKNCEMNLGPYSEFVAKLGPSKWMVFSPILFMASAVCGKDSSKTVRIKKQTVIEMPDDCRVYLKKHYLSTDNNIMMDFNVEVHSWKFDGNIFDPFFKDEKELFANIQEIISSKSKFGLGDLSHLKHYYTPTVDAIDHMWNFFSGLNIFSWFGNVYILVSILFTIYVLYWGYSKGLFKNCFKSRSHEGQVSYSREPRVNVGRQVNRHFEVRNVSVVEPVPPPYYPNPTAPVEIPNYPTQEMNYGGREVDYGEERLLAEECNPGPILKGGKKLEDFVCNHHVTKGAPGHCMGYFRPAH